MEMVLRNIDRSSISPQIEPTFSKCKDECIVICSLFFLLGNYATLISHPIKYISLFIDLCPFSTHRD